MTARESARDGETGPKAQVAAVLALHTKREGTNMAPYSYAYCSEDRQTWPCATVVALTQAECSTCCGDGYTVEPVMQCGGGEHDCGEGCAVPEQFPCPNCTTLRESKPRPIGDLEPF